MATNRLRRSRTSDSDDEPESRAGTPLSTAPNDGKRARLSNYLSDDDNDESSSPESDHDNDTPERNPRNGSTGGVFGFGVSQDRPPHQPGAIVRVKLTNFVTYTSAEFFPGPNLNMVIGPNGTGKSTLVCAICLGLGWGTQYLGRAKDAAEFVKHGSKEATIEIELQRATRGRTASKTNPIITRTIKREGNKSTYTLNGGATSGKAVMNLAQSFDIQIDNLCQFLPQDKVVEFAQMTPVQILESTQRAAAAPEMLEYHQNLIKLRGDQRELMNSNKGDREQLANLEHRQEMQKTEVERLRERAIVQKKLGWLQKCRPIPQYAETKARSKEARARQKELRKDLQNLQKETQPALQKLNSKKQYEASVLAIKQQRTKEIKRAEQECARLEHDIKVCEEKMTDLGNMYQAEKRSGIKDRETIKREEFKIRALQKQQESPPEPFDSRAINQEIQNRTTKLRDMEEEMEGLRGQAATLQEQRSERTEKLKGLKQDEARLSTQQGQLENKLQTLSSDTYQAWMWIKDNRALFAKDIYGPPLVECSVKDPSRANQVESLLQIGDYKVITTQCKEDFKLLQHELINKKRLHDISLRQCEIDTLDGFRRPLTQEQMQQYGLDGWVIDLLDGPPVVLAMMCQEKFLHQTATSAEHDINEDQFAKLQKTAVKGYVARNAGYVFQRRQEYGEAGNSTRIVNLKPARMWNAQTSDGGRKAELVSQMGELKLELAEIKEQMEPLRTRKLEIDQERESLTNEINEMKKEKDEKQMAQAAYNGLGTKIKQAEDKMAAAQANLDSLREKLGQLQQEQDDVMFEKADRVLEYVAAVHALQGKSQAALEVEIALIEARNDVQTLSARNEDILNLIRSKTKEEKEADVLATAEVAKGRKLREDVMRVRDEGLQLEEHEGDRGLIEMLENLSQNNEITEKDLDTLIEIEDAKLALTDGGDSNVVREFEERAKKVEKLRTKLADFTTKQTDYRAAIQEIRSMWEPELDGLVKKISDAFGDSFARIGCAGQVVVFKASSDDPADCTEDLGGVENGLDFINWAIHISVKFREDAPLSLLDSHRQSGGERAVSTIFYLMALQSLSRAPFRVVDEINQGMDPRNERMVHGRMVDIAAADDDGQGQGSQYFLITPKLLSGLKYKPGMTVLCIVSGENMPSAGDTRKKNDDGTWSMTPGHKIDFAAFARRARELGWNQTATGRRVDSGVSMDHSFGTLGPSQATQVGA